MLNFIAVLLIYIILLKIQKNNLLFVNKSKIQKYEKLLCDEIICF